MRPTYSSTGSKVEPAQLDDAALLAIGRLIRACAEIEDCVNLFICNLAEINESKLVVLLGKTAISKKIEIAEYLAKMNTAEAQELAKWAFQPNLFATLQCRNNVAHGKLLGRNQDGAWSFITSNTEAPDGPSAIQLAVSYTTEYLQQIAEATEEAIPILEERLKLKELRAGRYERDLLPHRKAQPRPKKGGKP